MNRLDAWIERFFFPECAEYRRRSVRVADRLGPFINTDRRMWRESALAAAVRPDDGQGHSPAP